MKKRILALSLAALSALSILSGCGAKADTSSSEPATSAPTSEESAAMHAAVGTWKTAQTLTPYFYEDFVDEGDTVEVMPFTNPGDQKTALLAGSLDMTGTTIPTAITAAAAGEPIKIVTTLCNRCSALVVGEDSDIETEADLKGKTIAYVPAPCTMRCYLMCCAAPDWIRIKM